MSFGHWWAFEIEKILSGREQRIKFTEGIMGIDDNCCVCFELETGGLIIGW
jgi:hypothetical protein